MSLQIGDSKYQDVLPIDLAPRASFDSSVKVREMQPSDYKKHRRSPSPALSAGSKRGRQDDGDDGSFDIGTFDSRHQHKKHKSHRHHGRHHSSRAGSDRQAGKRSSRRSQKHAAAPPSEKRLYRPGSPTESVGSADFELLADKHKLRNTSSSPKVVLPADQTLDQLRSKDFATRGRGSSHHDAVGFDNDDDEYETDDMEDDDDDDGEDGDEFDDGLDDEDDDGGEGLDGAGATGFYEDDDGEFKPLKRASSNKPQSDEGRPLTYEEQIKKKAFLLAKFERRRQHGLLKMEINDKMTLEELMIADNKLKYHTRGETMVGTMRRLTMFYIFILEAMATNFPRLHMDLTGFSESMMQKQTENDELLYEIWDMYHDSMQINPIWQHVVSITSQALMYSIGRKVMAGMMDNMMGGIKFQQQQPQQGQPGQQRPTMAHPPTAGAAAHHQPTGQYHQNGLAASIAQSQMPPQPPVIPDTDISMAPDELLQMLRDEEQAKLDKQRSEQQQQEREVAPVPSVTFAQNQQDANGSAAFKTIDLSAPTTSSGRKTAGGKSSRTIEIVKEKKKNESGRKQQQQETTSIPDLSRVDPRLSLTDEF